MKFNSVCLAALSLSTLSLFACGQKGGTEPDIWLLCDATETALSMSESSGLGQSADDVLAQVDGSHSSTAVYDEDLSNTAGLTVTLSSSASEATFMDQSVNGGGSDTSEDSDATPGSEDLCPDFLKFDVDVALSTDDGAFAEDIPSILRVYADGSIEVDGEMDLSQLQGSYAPDTTGSTSASLELEMAWDADAVFSGSLQLGMEGDSGSTAWASIDPILSWPLSDQE